MKNDLLYHNYSLVSVFLPREILNSNNRISIDTTTTSTPTVLHCETKRGDPFAMVQIRLKVLLSLPSRPPLAGRLQPP